MQADVTGRDPAADLIWIIMTLTGVVPEYDSPCSLGKKLILDGFQAGLQLINGYLRKRENFSRGILAGFDPKRHRYVGVSQTLKRLLPTPVIIALTALKDRGGDHRMPACAADWKQREGFDR